jgi:hypothetical protein
LTEITAVAPMPDSDHIYGCGNLDLAPAGGTGAAYFRMKNDGTVKFVYTVDTAEDDKCMGINYDTTTASLSVLI